MHDGHNDEGARYLNSRDSSNDIERQIYLEERRSASGDRRWRATCPGDYDGFGATAEAALLDLITINSKRPS